MVWRILCDFDGTISLQDTTDQLLERFAEPAWQEIEAQWVAGQISSAECMRRQVELLRVDKATLDKWIKSVEIDARFVEFVRFCERQKVDIRITSDGIDYVIKNTLARHGLGHLHVTANHLVFLKNGHYTLTPYDTIKACSRSGGVCKCGLSVMERAKKEHILYIGDGRSDFCVSQNAELVLAKSKLLTFCQQHDLPHVAFQDFGDVKATLHKLITPEHTFQQPTLQHALVIA
ncbi:MAG: phosphoserine phosphatase [Proteobacteria bacterium]|nr:phosphoserine phosphatase [Pseudomonadota bacterium]